MLTEKSLNDLALLAPYGMANPTPQFVVRDVKIILKPNLIMADRRFYAPELISELVKIVRKVGFEILADGEKRAIAKGIRIEKILKSGHIAEEILKTAREGNFDLIVTGARGLSKVREIMLGSVSYTLVRHSPCPVLIVK